jgi:hypothetical protein
MKQIRKNYGDVDWMEDVRSKIEKRAEMLRSEIEVRKQTLQKAPEGTIRAIRYGNTYQYYNRTDGKDTHGEYIPKKDIKLAKALAQKGYDKKFISEANKELKLLDEYLNRTEKGAIDNICNGLHPGKVTLITPVYQDRDTFVRKWEGVVYPPGYFAEGDAEHYTAKNERVRSKTEVNIANMLNLYGIPYRYEFPLVMDSIEFRPDFLCLNVRTRKEYVWEHFGMMELEDYARKNVDKISRYMLNGYIPGENFIMTFETTKKPLNSEVIKAMIENYLI